MAGWIGVDLDATLATYNGWKGPTHIGAPIAPMVERIKQWIMDGIEVRIFTARVSRQGSIQEVAAIRAAIGAWLVNVAGLPNLEVTNEKDYDMVELWDDRCVQVLPNTGMPITESSRMDEEQ